MTHWKVKFVASLCWIQLVSVNLVCSKCDSDSQIVKTNDGNVRGIQKRTLYRNVSYYAYLGIPYAEKPIGNLRFKAPIAIEAWKPNVLDAFQYRNSCIQQSFALGNSGPQSEDCLYLNIFVPDIKSPKKLPIIFYIHGGGFSEGSGNNFFYGPDFLIEQGVILITINYRLGAFGFLSLNTKHHSGNMGLKDQYIALKWVYHNIHTFGGRKNSITVMGQSAGAVSAHYHVLFHRSRKMIRNAICLSGSAFLFYSYLDNKSQLKKMYNFAHQFNTSIQHKRDLIHFLEHVPAQAIVNLTSQTTFNKTLTFDWAPVIEKKTAIRPILLKPSKELYKSIRYPLDISMMFGYTNYENLALVWSDIVNVTSMNDFLSTFNLVLPVHNLKPNFKSKSPYHRILDEIKCQYKSNVSTEHDKAVQYVNMISDLNMVSPIDEAVKTQVLYSKRPTFYYQFSINAKLNYIKRSSNITWHGATHGDDLCYIFRCQSMDSVYYDIIKTMHHDESSKISYNAIQNMSKMIANVAKHGRPNVGGYPTKRYRPVSRKRVNFLDITNKALIPGVSPKKDAVKFWHRILKSAESIRC